MSLSPKVFTLRFSDDLPLLHRASRLKGYPECKLNSGDEYEFLLRPQAIQIVDILYAGDRTTVYLGRCEDNTELALKFTDNTDILEEAGAYDFLTSIQGSVLPKLYGALNGAATEGENLFCLVLERFGTRLQRRFCDLAKAEKAKILDKLVEGHHAGLRHLDIAERNVLVKDGDYRIADLGHAELHDPPCQWTYNFTDHVEDDTVDAKDPSIGCGDIKARAEEMCFWDYGRLVLLNTFFVPKSDNLPSQSVVNSLRPQIGIDMYTVYFPTEAEQIAVKFFEDIHKRMTRGQSLESLEKKQHWLSYKLHKRWHEDRHEAFRPIPDMDYSGCESDSDEDDDLVTQ